MGRQLPELDPETTIDLQPRFSEIYGYQDPEIVLPLYLYGVEIITRDHETYPGLRRGVYNTEPDCSRDPVCIGSRDALLKTETQSVRLRVLIFQLRSEKYRDWEPIAEKC